MSAKEKNPAHRGPHEKRITIRCAACSKWKLVSRPDALTCSPKCRKMRSRWLKAEDALVVQKRNVPPKRPMKEKTAVRTPKGKN